LGRRALRTPGDRSLTTPLVLFIQEGPRAAPSYAEALFVSERTEDPRFQIRHGGSFFAPRPAAHPDDLPPTKGTPLSLEGLEIPQEVVAGDLAIVTGESDLPSAKSAQAIFLANGPEFERSPREHVERRLANAPWNTAVVRHLDLRAYELVEPYTPVAGGAMLAYAQASLTRPEILRFRRRIRERYAKPPSARVLLLLPCSARKP